MAKVVASERFVQEAAAVWSNAIKRELAASLKNIEAFPEMGSRNIPASVVAEFGKGVRKLVVGPFDLVYEYDQTSDRACIYALVPQKTAR